MAIIGTGIHKLHEKTQTFPLMGDTVQFESWEWALSCGGLLPDPSFTLPSSLCPPAPAGLPLSSLAQGLHGSSLERQNLLQAFSRSRHLDSVIHWYRWEMNGFVYLFSFPGSEPSKNGAWSQTASCQIQLQISCKTVVNILISSKYLETWVSFFFFNLNNSYYLPYHCWYHLAITAFILLSLDHSQSPRGLCNWNS